MNCAQMPRCGAGKPAQLLHLIYSLEPSRVIQGKYLVRWWAGYVSTGLWGARLEHISCHWKLHAKRAHKGIRPSLKKAYTMFTIKFEELPGSRMYTIKARRGRAHYLCCGLKERPLCSYDSHSGNFFNKSKTRVPRSMVPAALLLYSAKSFFHQHRENTPTAYQCSDTVNETHTVGSACNSPAFVDLCKHVIKLIRDEIKGSCVIVELLVPSGQHSIAKGIALQMVNVTGLFKCLLLYCSLYKMNILFMLKWRVIRSQTEMEPAMEWPEQWAPEIMELTCQCHSLCLRQYTGSFLFNNGSMPALLMHSFSGLILWN